MSPTEPTPSRWPALAAWSLIVAAALAATVWRLQISFDLSYFLPSPATPAEQVLHDRAGDAPGARVILVLLSGPSPASVRTAANELTAALDGFAQFSRVTGPALELNPAALPEYVRANRYLLTDQTLDVPTLRSALQSRFGELAMATSKSFERLIAADPTLAAVTVLERLSLVRELPATFELDDGTHAALIVAETRAGALELDRQAVAMQVVRERFAMFAPKELRLEQFGFGVYGVELQETIRREAMQRSLLATLAVLLVLTIAFRRLPPLLLAGVPLAIGFTCGMAAVALAFGEVHGTTLAFGFTLLGVAVDYPVHLLSHGRRVGLAAALRPTWPVIRLGMLSTVAGYASLLVTGSRGLSQLGLFSIVGLLSAGAVVRTLLPALGRSLAPWAAERSAIPTAPRLRHRYWMALAAAAGLWLAFQPRPWWNDDLSALSPVPTARLQRDSDLRGRAGLPDMRHLVVTKAPTMEAALARNAELDPWLAAARTNGQISAWLSASAILPPQAVQRRRQSELPDERALRERFASAVTGLPFRPAAFAPFFADVAAARNNSPISFEQARNGDFGGLLDTLLYRTAEGWTALTVLYGLQAPAELRAELQRRSNEILLIDLRDASQSLARRYRLHVLAVVGIASLLIVGLLLLFTRDRRAVAWIAGTTAGAVLGTFAVLAAALGPLNVFHLVSLLVVAALGLDYALFLSGRHGEPQSDDTRHAVMTCMASTVAAFGILALSSIPVLQAIGATVASGSLLCYLAARFGAGADERS